MPPVRWEADVHAHTLCWICWTTFSWGVRAEPGHPAAVEMLLPCPALSQHCQLWLNARVFGN